jgi:hypothetical protein
MCHRSPSANVLPNQVIDLKAKYGATFRGMAMSGKSKPKHSIKIQISTEAQNVK